MRQLSELMGIHRDVCGKEVFLKFCGGFGSNLYLKLSKTEYSMYLAPYTQPQLIHTSKKVSTNPYL